MKAIETCPTAYFGGHVDLRDHCQRRVYVYHSCVMGGDSLWGVALPKGHAAKSARPFDSPLKLGSQECD
jgi:hypothetical protein